MAGSPEFQRRKQSERLKRLLDPPAEPKPNYRGTGEAEVVPAYQLAAEIRLWSKEFLAAKGVEHEEGEDYGIQVGQLGVIGPVDYIATHSGSTTRQISRILHGELITVQFSEAEKILIAMGSEHKLITGEIQTVPNPHWSLEKWVAYMEERGCM